MPSSLSGDTAGSSRESYEPQSPVRRGPDPDDGRQPAEGTGLCLSGGGFRAMLFHVGVLKRLNEAGWLSRLDRVSSVSGGSITAGVLGLNWGRLGFEDGVAKRFDDMVTEPLRAFAHTKVDVSAVAVGGLLPFVSISDRVVSKYRKHLFGDSTLQDLPDEPRFVINATNLESGVLMRFSKPYLADYRVGRVIAPDVPLADAVAASSAFPPFLSPFELDLSGAEWTPGEGEAGYSAPGYRSEILLSDGGVYDNMGIETVWKRYKTVLISDAGGHLAPDSDPGRDWGTGMLRVLHILDSQVRSLRRSAVVEAFKSDSDPHNGFFISTITNFAEWPRPAKRSYMDVDPRVTDRLAGISTRLTDLPDEQQEQLINWGFAAADAGLLAFQDPDLPAAPWPYPDRPLT
jgi:NTE family protein